jgi:hypothetical protein
MRTTIDIDDDLLAAVRELARYEGTSAGRVASRLLRQALSGDRQRDSKGCEKETVGGFRPFPSRGKAVTNERIDAIRDEEGL